MSEFVVKCIRRFFGRVDNEAFVRRLGVSFGKDCRFVSVTKATFGGEPYLVQLGDHVEIAANVRFLPHDGGVWVFRKEFPKWDVFSPIVVGNNVFIGYGATILPGARIGNDCVIGAGSVVVGEIPSGSVAAGVPAKRLKSIDEYRTGLKGKILETKGLSREKKRAFLERHFGLSPTAENGRTKG